MLLAFKFVYNFFLCNFDIKVFNILGKGNHNLFSGDYVSFFSVLPSFSLARGAY